MKVTETDFEGLRIVEPRTFSDSRGFFFESYNSQSFHDAGMDMSFLQDNQSHSKRGVVRGLHFQKPPHAQTKLVRVLSGVILDIVVDLRKDQPTFGKHFRIELSSENNKQLLVPKGFAHGFLVVSEFADVLYKCDKLYQPQAEGGILFSDPTLHIDWPMDHSKLIFSEKDARLPSLAQTDIHF